MSLKPRRQEERLFCVRFVCDMNEFHNKGEANTLFLDADPGAHVLGSPLNLEKDLPRLWIGNVTFPLCRV